jgi:chromatin segregation and condensation protein Rec8/ScpA/Scc1 (kleisin family)
MRAEAGAVAAPPVALELDLDVFDGPFDLLVTLILRDEIDIWEVRVSRIIAEYVVHLADTGEFDLDATSQFVVLVAALLEMKSRLLLEEDIEEELEDLDPDEAARQLLERLVRYSQFRNAGEALRSAWDENSARLYRNAPVAAGAARPRHQPPGRPRRLSRQGAAPPAAHPRRRGRVHVRGGGAAGPARARGHVLRPARIALQR